jgi:hypothetical protein
VNIDLVSFFETGHLGNIKLGCSTDEVRQILGPPEDQSLQKKPLIWKYGNLQFVFDPDVSLILLLLSQDESWNPKISLTGWVPLVGMPLDAFKAALREKGIESAVDPELTFADQETLLVGAARVSALFVESKLSKMSVSTRKR